MCKKKKKCRNNQFLCYIYVCVNMYIFEMCYNNINQVKVIQIKESECKVANSVLLYISVCCISQRNCIKNFCSMCIYIEHNCISPPQQPWLSFFACAVDTLLCSPPQVPNVFTSLPMPNKRSLSAFVLSHSSVGPLQQTQLFLPLKPTQCCTEPLLL